MFSFRGIYLQLIQHAKHNCMPLSLVDKETFDRLKHSAGAGITIKGIPFSGTYDDFKDYVTHEKSVANVNVSESEAYSALTLTGVPGAVQAWRDCMLANQAGF